MTNQKILSIQMFYLWFVFGQWTYFCFMIDNRIGCSQNFDLLTYLLIFCRVTFTSDGGTEKDGFALSWYVLNPKELNPVFNCNFDGPLPLCAGECC